MDGDATAIPGAPDDWQDLYNGSGGALVKLVPIPDRVGLTNFVGPDNMFHHGCSDVKDLLSCYVKAADKTLPDKDDFENGSIALYTLSGLPAGGVPIQGLPAGMSGNHMNGDLIIVMQGDVYAPNGDASLGGWFFQKQIPAPAPGEAFSVDKTPGDIFIEADFTGGGSDVSFAIYTWDTNASKNVTQLLSGAGLRCGDIENPLGCAIANDAGPVPTVWDYIAKGDSGLSSQYPTTSFFEGIFNFSAALRLLNLQEGCYANFMYETRASHSIDAKLHDYILGALPMCSIEVSKTGPTQSKPTDDTQYTITVTNTGVVPLTKTSINDSLLGDISGDGDCGATLAPGAHCTINANRTVLPADPDPLNNTVTAVYNYGSDTVQGSASHSVDLFVPGVSITKEGPATSKVGDDVTYTFTITNLTDGDTSTPAKDGTAPDLKIDNIQDTLIGDLATNATSAGCDTLPLGGSCTFTVTRTILPTDSDPLNNTVTVHYHPDGFPNDLVASDTHSIDLFAPAVEIVKSGETISKEGDDVTYQFTITNKSDGDLGTAAQDGTAPDLLLDSINDTLLGDLITQANAAGCGTLAMGASCNFSVPRTVLAGDPDPLNNTVVVHYHPEAFDNDVTDNDSHSVDLFHPAVAIVKTGESISKAGDTVTYQFTITNNSDGNLNTAALDGTAPDLQLATISDTLLGNLATPANAAGCGTLALGASCSFSVQRTVLETDPDPLNNTVNVLYHPAGFPNNVTASDDHSVDLFAPAVQIVKTGETVSKAGDSVTYQFTITNNSDGNLNTPALDGIAPNLQLATISDTVLGDLLTPATAAGCGSLALGASCNFSVQRTILPTDPDPLTNTVNVLYHPAGFPNNVTASDSHSVDLFAPAVQIVKTGETVSKEGDTVTYHFTITNQSDGDLTTAALDGTSPPLLLNSINDTLLGDLITQANAAGCGTLAMGASCNFSVPRTVLASDPDPLNNTVVVHYHPTGLSNDISDTDSHSVDLFHPEVAIVKTGESISKAGDNVTYQFTITNNSDGNLNTAALDGTAPDLQLATINDTLLGNLATPANAAGCGTLALGASCTFSVQRTVLETDPDPLNNTVNVLYHPVGFPNNVTASDTHSVDLFAPAVQIVKTGDAVSKPGDNVTYHITITNMTDGNLNTAALDGVAPNLELASIGDNLLGDLSAQVPASCNSLPLGGSCSFDIIREILPTDPDPLNNTISVLYHPAGFPNNITSTDSHTVDLFKPEVEIIKTGNEDSKIGDDVTYTFTITNKTDGDLSTAAQDGTAPNLTLASITDTLLGDLSAEAGAAGCGTLDLGSSKSCSFQVSRTVLATDPDPLNNTVNVLYHPVGFPNDVSASASHSVNLFQPEISLSKICKDPSDGDNEIVVGQDAQFVFTLNNTSSADTPALNLVSANDTVLGNIGAQLPDPLPLGESTVSINYTTSEPGTLSNTVTVTYQVDGFPNTYTKTATASCNVVPGNEGCTPGYWKNHPEQWDGVAPDATSTIIYTLKFNATFGVTPTQSGLPDTATLMDAVNLGGGGLYALDRHAAAALPSADSVNYSYSVQGVIDLYRDAVGADPGPESIYSALAKLSAANEKGCPLN